MVSNQHAISHLTLLIGAITNRQIPPDETLQVGGDKKDNDQDLYGSDGHNWRSIIFSLLVIGFVITGIVIAIYLLG